MARTTWLDRGVYQLPYGTEYEPTEFGTTPTVLGVTDGASVVYIHEDGVDNDVEPLECFLQSGDFDIQDGQDMLAISRFIPDFSDQKGSADVLLSFKDYSATTGTSELAIKVSASATTLTLKDSDDFPNAGSVLIGTEIITYTGNNKTLKQLSGCTRGTSSSTATAHGSNKKVTNYSKVRINLSTITPTTTKIDTRGRGRQANVVISSNALKDTWRFGTLRMDVKPDGGR